jgi:Flp pilus assembly protein TadD
MGRRAEEVRRQAPRGVEARAEPTPAAAAAPPPGWDRLAWAWAALPALTALAFLPALDNGFLDLWDDQANFLANQDYRGLGWPQLRWAWTTTLLGVYQPVGWMLLELQYALGGMRPRTYHLASILMHGAVAVALYALIFELLRRVRPAWPADRRWALPAAAALAAALFAAHPLRVEVVAWVSCQSYLPCGFFCVTAVVAYLRAHRGGGSGRPGWPVASLALYAAALLSKAVAVGLPVVLLVLDVYPLRRLGPGRWAGPEARRAWREKSPFALLALAFAAVAIVSRRSARSSLNIKEPAFDFGTRLVHAGYGLGLYVYETLVPVNLIAFDLSPDRFDPSEPRFALGVAAALALTVAAVALRRRWPGLLAAWVAYVAIVSPNLGFLRFGAQVAADRYTYVATMGFYALAAGALARGLISARRPAVVVATALAVVAGLSALTWRQCRVWHDTETLWVHALGRGAGYSPDLHNNLGAARARRGDYDAAAVELAEAVRLRPGFVEARASLGEVCRRLGRFDQAATHLSEAARLEPERADVQTSLAEVRNRLGMALFRQGRFAESATQYTELARMRPGDAEVQYNLGACLLRQERPADAAARFAEALRLKPDFPAARKALQTARDRSH